MENRIWIMPVLETERLLLRRLTLQDAHDVFSYASDPEMTRYLMWSPHKSIDDSLTFIASAIDRYEQRQPGPWGIVLKETQTIIGTCDYIHWRPEHGRGEIGYALNRQHWGRGLMTEAVREIIAYGFREKGLNRIQAMCEIPNVASARVMEKAGMTFEGILRQYMVQRDKFRDMKIYAILREDFRA